MKKENGITLIAVLVIILVVALVIGVAFFTSKKEPVNNEQLSESKNEIISEEVDQEDIDLSKATLIKGVRVNGFMKVMDNYEIYFESITDYEDRGECTCSEEIYNIIYFLQDYDVYLDVYVTNEEKPKLIDLKLYNEKTDEEITNIKNEEDIRKYFGMYLEGEYEEELIFVENESNAFGIPGTPSVGFSSDEDEQRSYKIYDLLFKKLDDTEFRLRYLVYDNEEDKIKDLVENEKYKVKFEVTKGTFDYEYLLIEFSREKR